MRIVIIISTAYRFYRFQLGSPNRAHKATTLFVSPAARVLDCPGLLLLAADSDLSGASSLLSTLSPLIPHLPSGYERPWLTNSLIDHPTLSSATLTTLESFAHLSLLFAHLPSCSLLQSCLPLLHRRLSICHSSARSSSHNTQMTLHPQLHLPHSHQLPQSCILLRTMSPTTFPSKTDQRTIAGALNRPPSQHSPAPTHPHQRHYRLPFAYGNGVGAGTNLLPPSSVTMTTGN